MSRRTELLLCYLTATLVVVARTVPFMQPGVRLDFDQAIVGLMAKHISEGRAYPLFFYGQSYLLALEAYLAAPFMWLLGPTEVALKLPLLGMNLAAALLVIRVAHRDLGVRPVLALACALPIVLPPIVVGTRLMEAMGGNAELPLYALLIWIARSRAWTFAIVAAVSFAHRELVAIPLAALLALEAARGVLWSRPAIERWAITAVMAAAVRTAVGALRPFAPMFGPGSMVRPGDVDISSAAAVGAQLCADPSRWAQRFDALVGNHLPLLFGGAPGPLSGVGVNSGVGHGHPGITTWVLGIIAAGVLLGGIRAVRGRQSTAGPGSIADPKWPWPGDTMQGAVAPARDAGWYLLLVGLISTLVYWLVACSQIGMETFRYDLLACLLPVGAVLLGVAGGSRAAMAGMVTAVVIWIGIGAGDYLALADEIRSGRWADRRGQAIAALEARGFTVLWGEFRLAHVMTFRSQERLVVAATDRERIDDYTRRARAASGPVMRIGSCPGGEELVPTISLCPGPPP